MNNQKKEKNKKLKVYIVGGKMYREYSSWIYQDHVNTSNLEEADLVIFAGGEDVTPSLYGEDAHSTTGNWYDRDIEEIEIFKKAQKLDKYCWGTCRGSQFLSVMSGAKLVQHMYHPSFHDIKVITGERYRVISTHHQMQYPNVLPEEDYTLIGWAENLSDEHWLNPTINLSVLSKEAEIVYYHKTNCLAVQSHPEMMSKESPFVAYLNDLLEIFLAGKIQKQKKDNDRKNNHLNNAA